MALPAAAHAAMSRIPREPLLALDDPELSGKRFERFSLDLVRALPEVSDAHLYAVHGEDQGGIDIHADLCDGRVRSIQCRRVKRFTKTSAEKLIGDTTYEADEHRVWCTCGMSGGARDTLRATPRWDGWDIEQLSSAVRRLPREVGRWIVEDHLGGVARKRFLGPEADLSVVPARRWFESSDGRAASLRTDQTLRGRQALLDELIGAVRDLDCRIAVLVGWGGIGKTRMLRALADALPDERLLLLRDGVEVTAALAEELPPAPCTLLIDDAHGRPALQSILTTVFADDDPRTVVLATRAQRLAALRADVLNAGVGADAVRELTPMAALSQDQATALASEELDDEHRGAAPALAAVTRDVPALCVLGARLINEGDLAPGELVHHDAARRDILARFRDELIGRVSDQADRAVVRELLMLIAALQPVELASDGMVRWLAEQLERTPDEVRAGIRGLEEGGLLLGAGRRRRIVPDVLADHILREACVGVDGRPTGRADHLVAVAPAWALSRVLANLAELDWRLGAPGEHPLLEAVLARVGRDIIAAAALDRRRMLERLGHSAVFLADWITSLAREVLDHPAEDSPLFLDHSVTDVEARHALVPLLRDASLVPGQTQAAMFLLWEIGRDLDERSWHTDADPLDAIRRLGSYELRGPYADALVSFVEQLVADEEDAEGRRALPITLLSRLTSREGTTSSRRGSTVSLGSYFVNAAATRPLRDRVRALLVDRCLYGGPRTRAAAAQLLGNMLRQPHGYYGRGVPREAIAQWRPEQLAIGGDIGSIMERSADVVVISRLRDSLDRHARHGAIRGVKTAFRRLQREHPMSSEEVLVRALTDRLGDLDSHATAQRRLQNVAGRLARESPEVDDLLGRVDDVMDRLAAADPESHADPGALMGALADRDLDWAMEAAHLLIAAPGRPAARAVGVLLTAVVSHAPERAREVVTELAGAGDPILRRLAGDHISRMRWMADSDAPERELAVTLAADDDPVVVSRAVLTAHRAADDEPQLARAVVSAIPALADPQLAENVCMVLSHDLGLTSADEDRLLQRLMACPDVSYWHDRLLVGMSRRRPEAVLNYLLARVESRDDIGYRAVPFDGLSSDPVAGQPEARPGFLRQILQFAALHLDAGAFDEATLYWSYAAGQPEGLNVLADALTDSAMQERDAALEVLADGPHDIALANPDWVGSVLEAVDAGTLDKLQGALSASLTSGIKEGTPGQPFQRDVVLRDRAAELAAAARPGSRAAVFWKSMVRVAKADIERSLERDRELEDE